jgi:hypothetical protein
MCCMYQVCLLLNCVSKALTVHKDVEFVSAYDAQVVVYAFFKHV